MLKWTSRRLFALAAFLPFTFAACAQPTAPPPAPREFRALWVSTVNNGTWPSQPGLRAEDQRKEMLAILDRAVRLKMNAIIFQVRTSCDALYPSNLEPWSEFLTGAQGRPPQPMYDPLQAWIDETHRRGLELHAWFNPYRARSDKAKGPDAANHISRTHPELVRKYGDQLWLDPGEPNTAEWSLHVFLDVVKRYDIDGVHIDDYFYPYVERDARKQAIEFPDNPSWRRYVRGGGRLARDDWRRENVNGFVERLYRSIKQTKKQVKFGISPFGIWRPNNPPGIKGLDAYDQLYADSRKWINNGWCDYWSPQLYWPTTAKEQSFPLLLAWWADQNTQRRNFWPGLAATRARDGAQQNVQELLKEIELTRKRGGGNILWNAGAVANETVINALATGPYAQPALVPASPWLDNVSPPAPAATASRDTAQVMLRITGSNDDEDQWQWAVWAHYGREWRFFVLPATARTVGLPEDRRRGAIDQVVVSAVDRCGNESPRIVVPVK
jgi:uncharacterized lipoprotein YddW (UPF0748 family)